MKLILAAPSTIPARTANSIQSMKMAQAFAELGHRVLVLAPGKDPAVLWDELAGHYGLQQQFEIEWLRGLPALRRYDYGLQVVRRARRWGADLLFTRLPQAAAMAAQRGLPTVLEVHDMPPGRMGPRLLRAFMDGSGARRLVSISRALADDLTEKYPIPPELVSVLPDGVDLRRYHKLPTTTEARHKLYLPERFTAGYTGHLYRGRGADFILELAKILPEVTFLLVGGEPHTVAEFHAHAEGLDNVVLTGFVSNTDLPLYQAACDVLLMPYQQQVSASSGGDIARYLSPMKMFEYLASGRVVMASDLPVLAEVLKADNSVILPGSKPEPWVRAILELRENPEVRELLGANGRRTAEKHTWGARAESILQDLPHSL